MSVDGPPDDPDSSPFIRVPVESEETPVPANPWPESNYEQYKERAAPLFAAPVVTKPTLASLLVTIDAPVQSKLFMPGPIELFSASELDQVTPSGVGCWRN
jgi:hypothetical protein